MNCHFKAQPWSFYAKVTILKYFAVYCNNFRWKWNLRTKGDFGSPILRFWVRPWLSARTRLELGHYHKINETADNGGHHLIFQLPEDAASHV